MLKMAVRTVVIEGEAHLGRPASNHSTNYRSATIHGNAVPVTDPQEILGGLRAIVDHIIAGRWDQVRKRRLPSSAKPASGASR